eukprot:448043-Rhodomonas_salina.1
MADEQTTTRRSRRSRKSLDAEEDVWRNQVMMPDWMIAVPEGLASQWLVTPRPQGYAALAKPETRCGAQEEVPAREEGKTEDACR